MRKLTIGVRGRGVLISATGVPGGHRLVTAEQARQYAVQLLDAADTADGGDDEDDEDEKRGAPPEGGKAPETTGDVTQD